MADEHAEGNSPRNTSEATPPHVDDSPEMVSQPSPPPPEDERVTSSSDCQPPEVADFAVEQRVSSSCEQDQSVGAEPSSREEASAGQISSDPAPEIENPPCRESGLICLMNTPPKWSVGNESAPSADFKDPIKVIERVGAAYREMIGFHEPSGKSSTKRNVEEKSSLLMAQPTDQPKLSLRENPDPSADEEKQIKAEELIRAAVDASLKGSYEPIGKSDIKRNVDEESDDANQQLDVEDLSPASKCSSENVDLGSNSSRRGSGSGATVEAGLGSNSSPRITIGIEEKISLGIGTAKNVSLEGELPSSKTSLAIPVSGAMNVGLKSESSPSKISTSSVEGSGSASGILQEKVSPKRKINLKDQHLPPKRSTPSTSPGKFQKQSDSQMSTLLEELDIKETKGEPGSSEPICGHEQNIEMEESNESKTRETEQESNMEGDETDPQEAQGETTEKYSKKDDTEMEDRE